MQDVVFAAGDRCQASGGARSVWSSGAGPGTTVSAGGTVLANEHVRVDVDPVDGTLTIDADGVHVTRANRLVDGGDGGDTYNYSPPADRHDRRLPRVGERHGRGVGPGARPHRGDRDVPAAHPRDRRRAIVLPPQRRHRRGRAAHRPRAAHRRALPPRAGRARPPRARPPAARALPAPRLRRRLRRRVRVRGGAPRSDRRGRAPRGRPPHVRVAPIRRLLRW